MLCEDIWKLSSMFIYVEFIYICRFMNKIADRLARYSISLLKEILGRSFSQVGSFRMQKTCLNYVFR